MSNQQKINKRFIGLIDDLYVVTEALNERLNVHKEEIKKLKEKYEIKN